MCVTLPANYFCSLHGQTLVFLCTHIVISKYIRKTWPAASGIEFCFRQKQGIAATQTMVCAPGFSLHILSAERSFCTFFSTDFELFRSQLLFPLRLSFGFKVSQVFLSLIVQQYFSCTYILLKTIFLILKSC